MKLHTILLLYLAALTGVLFAQEKKPTEPVKAVSSKPETTSEKAKMLMSNLLKQDGRNKEAVQKMWDEVMKTAKDGEALKKLDFLKPFDKDDAKVAQEKAKKLEELANTTEFKKAKSELESMLPDDSKSRIADTVQKKKPQIESKPKGLPPPVSFDKIKEPSPVIAQAGPTLIPISAIQLDARSVIMPPTMDPANLKKPLDPQDPRARTVKLKGNARIRGQNLAIDGDEIIAVMKPGVLAGSAKTEKSAKKDNMIAEAPSGQDDIERLWIIGRARAMILGTDGTVKIGRGGMMEYSDKTGGFVIREWPEAQVEGNAFLAKEKDAVINMSAARELNSEKCSLVVGQTPLTKKDFPTPDQPVPLPTAKRPVEPTGAPLIR